MKKIFIGVFIFLILPAICLANEPDITSNPQIEPTAPNPPPVPLWQADSKFNDFLGEEAVVGEYFLRPPKDYAVSEIPGPEGTKFLNWKGPVREDKTYPHLTMSVVTVSEDEKHDYTAAEAMEILLAGIEQNRSDWSVAPSEEGQINGMNFLRRDWTGIDKISGVQMKGFMYVMVEGKKIVNLASQDAVGHQDALDVARAAVLTVHKK